MAPNEVEVSGRVERETVSVGSKSERLAVILITDDGKTYLLRNGNAPAFGDNSLDSLVGTAITAKGFALDQTLILREWRVRD